MGLAIALLLGVASQSAASPTAIASSNVETAIPETLVNLSPVSTSEPPVSDEIETTGLFENSALSSVTPVDSLQSLTPLADRKASPTAIAQTSAPGSSSQADSAEQLNLAPEMIENSPVLQRWLEEIPDVRSEIRNDPSFRARLRLGYTQFPSTEQSGGLNAGVEDVFLGRTGLTVSAEYQATFEGDRQTYGADLRYYVRPLGSYINIAPVIGYRHLETEGYSTDGVNLGLRLLLALSRTGAADVSLTQSWVAPRTDDEVGITTLSFGYALTHRLRLATDLQQQNSRAAKDNRVGIVLEWML